MSSQPSTPQRNKKSRPVLSGLHAALRRRKRTPTASAAVVTTTSSSSSPSRQQPPLSPRPSITITTNNHTGSGGNDDDDDHCNTHNSRPIAHRLITKQRHRSADFDKRRKSGGFSSLYLTNASSTTPLARSSWDRDEMFIQQLKHRMNEENVSIRHLPPADVVSALLARFPQSVEQAVLYYCEQRAKWISEHGQFCENEEDGDTSKKSGVDEFHEHLKGMLERAMEAKRLHRRHGSGSLDGSRDCGSGSGGDNGGSGEISSLSALYAALPESKKKYMFDVEFEELNPMPPTPYLEPPKLYAQQPFWLMQLLLETMLNGGYLVSGLYIPHEVWFQKGAKLPGQQAKINFITGVNEHLQFLSRIDLDDPENVHIVLQNFNERCQKLYITLSKQLPTKSSKSSNQDGGSSSGSKSEASEAKEESNFDHSGTSGSSSSSSSSTSVGGATTTTLILDKPLEKKGRKKILAMGKDILAKTKKSFKKELQKTSANRERKIEKQLYIPLLITMFEKSQFISQWIDKISKDKIDERGQVSFEDPLMHDIYGELENLSFFFMLVLRKFVFRDMFTLIERYMKKARESTSRLFPKKFKLD